MKDHYEKDAIIPLPGKCADCANRHYNPENYLYVCDDCVHFGACDCPVSGLTVWHKKGCVNYE